MENIESLITASGVFFLVAYIDPGTGSMIIKVFIGFLVGALLALKVFWVRVRAWVKNLFFKGKS